MDGENDTTQNAELALTSATPALPPAKEEQKLTEDEAFAVIAAAEFAPAIERVKFIAKKRFGSYLVEQLDVPYLVTTVWDDLEQMQSSLADLGKLGRDERADKEVRVSAYVAQTHVVKSVIDLVTKLQTLSPKDNKRGNMGKNLPPSIGGNMIFAENVLVQEQQSANSGNDQDSQ
jgi:hypothetical protein